MSESPLECGSAPADAPAQGSVCDDPELRKEVQRDLFGEELLPPVLKQIPHRSSNVRREKFVREYVLCGRNATEAAYRAGYGGGDRKKCRYYGSELLSFPDIQALIALFEDEVRGRDLVRAEELVEAAWKDHAGARKADASGRRGLLEFLAKLGGYLTDKVELSGKAVSIKDLIACHEALTDGGENEPPGADR